MERAIGKGKRHILSPSSGIVILNLCSRKEEEEEIGGGENHLKEDNYTFI